MCVRTPEWTVMSGDLPSRPARIAISFWPKIRADASWKPNALRGRVMLEQLGFAPALFVRGRGSIADLFKPKRRCGIYVLHFTDDHFYVGKAVDVTRRYIEHRKTHADIEKISFKVMASVKHAAEERRIIGVLEAEGWPLRNITFASMPKGDSDFDLIMMPEDQERWLHDLEWIDSAGSRLTNPDLRQRYRQTFDHFNGLPHAPQVIDVLRDYVRLGIPAIRRGEVSFWACSCLPAFASPSVGLHSRINIDWQEVMTAFDFEGELWFSVHLARSPLEQAFGASLGRLQRRYPSAEYINHQYDPGGSDQTSFDIPARAIQTFITDPHILPAIRLFNVRLMKKGPCTFGRYHCLDLADRLIE